MKTRILSTACLSFPLACALAALLAGQSAHAISYNWAGNTGEAWNTGSSWSGTTVPLITDDLTILGPLNVAGVLNIDFNADNPARSLIFTNTAATTITNATSGADKTLTLGSGGITTGTGAVTLGSITANQAVNITLDAAQTWNVGAGGMTVTNVVGGLATGLTKTGAGNLTFNGNTVNTFTGGLNANGGKVTLDYANLATPTDLVAATNALQVSGGALTIAGQDVAAATTAQTFAGTTLGAGLNTLNIAKGALATSATLNLGALTVNSGSSAIFSPTTAWTTTASTTEIVNITAGGTVPVLPVGAVTAFVGASVFHRVAAGAAGTLRLAAVNSSGQLLQKIKAGNFAVGTGVDTTEFYEHAAGSIALTDTGASIYGLLLTTATANTSITIANSGTLTLNSVIQTKAADSVTIAPGTGVSNVVIGAEKNLVLAMDNAAGLAISAPIANFNSTGGTGGDASAVTIVGTNSSAGGVTLSGNNTYSGVTTVDGTAQIAAKNLLTVNHNNALGTTAGGTVLIGGLASSDGPRILLNNGITVTGETLTIRTGGVGTRSSLTQPTNANSAWHGDVVVDAHQGVSQIFANGATSGVMTIGASDTDTMTANGTPSFRGTGLGTVNSTISGVGGLGKADAGTWTLTAANSYLGTTNIGSGGILQIGAGSTTGTLGTGNVTNAGTLQFNRTNTYTLAAGNLVTGAGAVTLANTGSVATTVDGQFNTTGALNFGSVAGSTPVSALDLTNGSSTFGSLNVRTNSATPNTITIGSGKTLQINGAVTFGYNGNSETKVTATGSGTLSVGTSVTPTNANMTLGGATADAIANHTTLDMSGLATFYANLGTGVLRAGSTATANNPGSSSTVTLAGNSTIIATSIILASRDGNPKGTQTLKLGTGTNVINATDIFLGGRGAADGRANGSLIFNDPTLGTLTLRGLAGGSSRANMSISLNGFGSGSSGFGLFDSKGHTVDLLVETLTVGKRNAPGGVGGNPAVQGRFDFDTGTLDVNNLEVGFHLSSSDTGSSVTGNVNLSGGTTTINNTGNAARLGVKATTGGTFGTGNLNISGSANVTIAAFGGSSLILGDAAATGTATGAVNLTGGTLTAAGDIIRGATVGTSVGTILISGGTLNMGGNDIGTVTEPATLTAESGTISNVATINGSGGLTKTTAGTLTVSGTNTYTGTTSVSDGTLALGADNALPATPVSIGTATLAAATFDDTLGTLDVTGSAVINLGSGANLVFANSSAITWTGPNLNITGAFVSGSSLNFGPGGLSAAQLLLISSPGFTGFGLNGAGFLTATGSASNYASWAIANGIPGEPASGDFDKDGITNIVEYALGKSPTVSSQPAGVLAGNVITYTKGVDAITNGDVSWVIETSTTLALGSWTPEPVIAGPTLTYTFTPGTPPTKFARLKVTQIP